MIKKETAQHCLDILKSITFPVNVPNAREEATKLFNAIEDLEQHLTKEK